MQVLIEALGRTAYRLSDESHALSLVPWPAGKAKNGGGSMRRIVKSLVPLIILTFSTTAAAGGQNDADTVNSLLEKLKSSDWSTPRGIFGLA